MTPAEQIAEKHNKALAGKPAGAGHNASLASYVERLQNLEEEKRQLSEDIRDLKKEAKLHEINPRALTAVVKRRMEDADKKEKRVALEDTVDSYLHRLGLLG